MKELQNILDIQNTNTDPAVLATLVKVEGSSYRRVGARLLWRGNGTRLGSISGGCLEEDLIERAKTVLQSGVAQTVVYDTTAENELVWGVGLGCHGVVRVLLEPVTGVPPHWQKVLSVWRERLPAVAVSVFQAREGMQTGTRAVLGGDGAWSGDAPSDEIKAEAQATLVEKRSRYAGQSGADVFLEFLPPPSWLTIFGAGDDALPLARLAEGLGWKVTVADPRGAFATRARFPHASEVRVISPETLEGFSFDPWCMAVVMTHHYRFDLPLLRQLLPLRLPYLGLLGPKKRAERILEELQKGGMEVSAAMREKLHAPVGLDLGAGTPDEVAHAIVAEILAVQNHRDGRPLKQRTRPIHD